MAIDSAGRLVQNFLFSRGDNKTIVHTLTNADGTAFDLTGASAKLTVSDEEFPRNESKQIFELTGAIQDPATGGIIHYQPTTAQANQTPRVRYYNIQITYADGTRATECRGQWEYDGHDISDPAAD